MKILTDLHGETAEPLESVRQLGVATEAACAAIGQVVRLPAAASNWDMVTLAHWLAAEAADCDAAVLTNSKAARYCKERLETKRVVYAALGDLTHGATSLRDVASSLTANDVVWVTSSADAEICSNLLDCPKETIQVVGCPVDSETFKPLDDRRRTEIRQQYGVGERDILLIYPGRLSITKNIPSLIRLRALVQQRSGRKTWLLMPDRITTETVPEYRLHHGDVEKSITAARAQFDGADTVKQFTWANEQVLSELLAAADFGVSLSLQLGENFGIGVAQCLATGTRAICTSWGGYRDIIGDESCGTAIPTWITQRGPRFDLLAAANAVVELADVAPGRADRVRLHEATRKRYGLEGYNVALARMVLGRQPGLESGAKPKRIRLQLSDVGSRIQNDLAAESNSLGDGRPVPLRLKIDDWDDPNVNALIGPYVSHRRIPGPASCRTCVAGAAIGGYFYSDDPLWSFRIAVPPALTDYVTQAISAYQGETDPNMENSDTELPAEALAALQAAGVLMSQLRPRTESDDLIAGVF